MVERARWWCSKGKRRRDDADEGRSCREWKLERPKKFQICGWRVRVWEVLKLECSIRCRFYLGGLWFDV